MCKTTILHAKNRSENWREAYLKLMFKWWTFLIIWYSFDLATHPHSMLLVFRHRTFHYNCYTNTLLSSIFPKLSSKLLRYSRQNYSLHSSSFDIYSAITVEFNNLIFNHLNPHARCIILHLWRTTCHPLYFLKVIFIYYSRELRNHLAARSGWRWQR